MISLAAQQGRQHTLGDLPRRTALRHPHKLALVDGATRLTFAELELATARLTPRGIRSRVKKPIRAHRPSLSQPPQPFCQSMSGRLSCPRAGLAGSEVTVMVPLSSG